MFVHHQSILAIRLHLNGLICNEKEADEDQFDMSGVESLQNPLIHKQHGCSDEDLQEVMKRRGNDMFFARDLELCKTENIVQFNNQDFINIIFGTGERKSQAIYELFGAWQKSHNSEIMKIEGNKMRDSIERREISQF